MKGLTSLALLAITSLSSAATLSSSPTCKPTVSVTFTKTATVAASTKTATRTLTKTATVIASTRTATVTFTTAATVTASAKTATVTLTKTATVTASARTATVTQIQTSTAIVSTTVISTSTKTSTRTKTISKTITASPTVTKLNLYYLQGTSTLYAAETPLANYNATLIDFDDDRTKALSIIINKNNTVVSANGLHPGNFLAYAPSFDGTAQNQSNAAFLSQADVGGQGGTEAHCAMQNGQFQCEWNTRDVYDAAFWLCNATLSLAAPGFDNSGCIGLGEGTGTQISLLAATALG